MKVGVPLGIVPMLLLLLLLLSFAPGQEARTMRYGSGSFVSSFVQNTGKGGTRRIKPADNLKDGLSRLCESVEVANWKGVNHISYACEDTEMALKCPTGTEIQVQTAAYKKASASKCNPVLLKSNFVSASCTSDKEDLRDPVRAMCDGQERCQFTVDKDVLDNTVTAFCMYVEVEYQCTERADSGPKRAYACQSNMLVLECQAGMHVVVKNATYAKPVGTKCNLNDNSPTVSCDFDSTDIMITHCAGQRKCEVPVSDKLRTGGSGGSGCQDEYVEVEYSCEKNDVICTHSSRKQNVDFGYRGLDYFNVLHWIDMLMNIVQTVIDAADN